MLTDFGMFSHDGEFLHLTPGVLDIWPGYMWDGASGAFDTDSFMTASLFHDALYQLIREGVLPVKPFRKRADKLLLKICKEEGMSFVRRRYVYQAVRWFGGGAAE